MLCSDLIFYLFKKRKKKKGIKKTRVKPEGTSDHRHKKTKLTDE